MPDNNAEFLAEVVGLLLIGGLEIQAELKFVCVVGFNKED
mgnify:CR=1 FL=1